ncbi:MAG TPA: sigma-70 family RNA polymerase sigma factor [[Clostridium] spiroforme]|uniref:Sigma-70 family RNA polymerase sigma factor n=1 Tax=Thomasclavelia spiroformis TaxID=29348 RepID=A0A921KIT7_9FIRM|nr:sigma-70 family RNA polymerase sigma factor [Thomasclavelia spiroformis]
MGFNYSEEYEKWLKWKKEEEELLRSLEVPENVIEELRAYDWSEFNRKRSILSKQFPTKEIFFVLSPVYDQRDVKDVDDLLDEIKNENLYGILSNTDKETLNIVLLKMFGYSISEISKMTGIPRSTIYYRIHLLKEKIKKI